MVFGFCCGAGRCLMREGKTLGNFGVGDVDIGRSL